MPKYVGAAKVRALFDVSPQTLKNWAIGGKIGYKAIDNATRKTWLYDIESIGNFIQSKQDNDDKKQIEVATTILYARVSSKKQEADLGGQIKLLKDSFPESELITDIASGLNFTRPGFSSLVERICKEEIGRVVVTYKDRLCRFGFELFEQICKEHQCKILVIGPSDTQTEEQELQEDLLSIVNVFVAKRNGKRAADFRKQRSQASSSSKSPVNSL